MRHKETYSSSQTERRLQFVKQYRKFATATHFCRVCQKAIERRSWRSLFCGGEYICQSCYLTLSPVYRPLLFGNTKGYAIYDKNEKIIGLLQSFLKENAEKIGPALFSYAHLFFVLRFYHYPIIPLPEKDLEFAFRPAEKIFAPFNMEVADILHERIVEKNDKIIQKLEIKVRSRIPSKAIIFSCRSNPKALKEATILLKSRGLKKAIYLCFCE